jgi:hypothetical protein
MPTKLMLLCRELELLSLSELPNLQMEEYMAGYQCAASYKLPTATDTSIPPMILQEDSLFMIL